MNTFNELIRKANDEAYKPLIFDFKKHKDMKAVRALIRQKKIKTVIDEFIEQVKELTLVKNPKLLQKPQADSFIKDDLIRGKWVYYPWHSALVHILGREDYIRLKTSRNENLILCSEQKKFQEFKIGIAGLNVGNPAAICLVLEGGGLEMKFADNDVLSLSNLNRFRASIVDLGLNKAILSTRQVYEINPYLKIKVFSMGIKSGRTEEFLLNPKINVLIEEMDNLALKIEIREQARKHRIPVIMVTGNGENVIIDIERFDLNPKLPLLNGYLKSGIIKKIKSGQVDQMAFQAKILLARDFIGAKYLTKRLRDSFPLVGSKLAGIPQLAESSFLRGAALCYVVRQIAIGGKMPSGRYRLDLDKITKH